MIDPPDTATTDHTVHTLGVRFQGHDGVEVDATVVQSLNRFTRTGIVPGAELDILYDPRNPQNLVVLGASSVVLIDNPRHAFDGEPVVAIARIPNPSPDAGTHRPPDGGERIG